MLVQNLPAQFKNDSRVSIVQSFGDGATVVRVPRYQEFTVLLREFALARVGTLDFAGNSSIAISVVVPEGEDYDVREGRVFLKMNTAQNRGERLLVEVPAHDVPGFIRAVVSRGYTLEHIYDY